MTRYNDLYVKFINAYNRVKARYGEEYGNEIMQRLGLSISDEKVLEIALSYNWQDEYMAKARTTVSRASGNVAVMLRGRPGALPTPMQTTPPPRRPSSTPSPPPNALPAVAAPAVTSKSPPAAGPSSPVAPLALPPAVVPEAAHPANEGVWAIYGFKSLFCFHDV